MCLWQFKCEKARFAWRGFDTSSLNKFLPPQTGSKFLVLLYNTSALSNIHFSHWMYSKIMRIAWAIYEKHDKCDSCISFECHCTFLFQLILDFIYLHVTLVTLNGCSFSTTLSLYVVFSFFLLYLYLLVPSVAASQGQAGSSWKIIKLQSAWGTLRLTLAWSPWSPHQTSSQFGRTEIICHL